MIGRVRSAAMVGLDHTPVIVEAHVSAGLPAFHLIGLSGTAGRQAADRVRAALSALGVTMPNRKVLVSLVPADVPKSGARFDLAVAIAVLRALGVVPADGARPAVCLGEVGLDGAVLPVPGTLPTAAALVGQDVELLVADAAVPEARLADGVAVVPVADLREAVELLRGEAVARTLPEQPPAGSDGPSPDLAEVRGQPEARRALEVAAAGGHHLLLLGPPGCGKSMLARRLPSILPPLGDDQALELATIRSVAGLAVTGPGGRLERIPPFRAPHHRMSAPALLGGGSGVARPGELSLAHRGVFFMDELLEWPRGLLEALRAPLEEGVVRVARSRALVRYPARVQLVAAANPCPCGGGAACACADEQIWAYRARLSGPLADRLDLAPAVAPLRGADLVGHEPGEPSAAVAERVAAARVAAAQRFGPGVRNAEADPEALRRGAAPAALAALVDAVERGELTGRGYDRALRVARTCADLEGADTIAREHVLEAMAHRAALRRARVQPGMALRDAVG